MTKPYIPKGDSDFLLWALNFSNYLTAHATTMGFSESDASNIAAAANDFDILLNQHIAKRDAAAAARVQKDAGRTSTIDQIRAMARRIQASPQVTNEDRQAMGLTVRDGVRSLATEPNMKKPYGIIDTSKPFRHKIKYRQQGAEGRGKPDYAIGCEVWMKIAAAGEPVPVNPQDLKCLGTNSASPYTCEFAGGDACKVAHYRLRWITRDGTKGPWSELISATIVG